MDRITLHDTVLSAIVKMSEGNPGAVTVMTALDVARIDPDSVLGLFGPLFWFDTHRIYGGRIWEFFKDVCKSSQVNVLTVQRADQLRIKTYTGQTEFDFPALLAAVRAQLPDFAKGMEP